MVMAFLCLDSRDIAMRGIFSGQTPHCGGSMACALYPVVYKDHSWQLPLVKLGSRILILAGGCTVPKDTLLAFLQTTYEPQHNEE